MSSTGSRRSPCKGLSLLNAEEADRGGQEVLLRKGFLSREASPACVYMAI